jgi:arylsulfatase A-like enzyme
LTVPPNILYLHSHDTGRYVQPYGHQIPTPNIQLLADQGVLFRRAFSVAPTCSGSRAALATGQVPHSNGMIGLAHRGFALNDVGEHVLHTLRDGAGYHSELLGEQHITEDPEQIGYDRVHRIPTTNVDAVAPVAVERICAGLPEPFFLSVGFFETHRNYFAPSSVRDTLYSLPPDNLPDLPETRADMAAFKQSARSLDQGVGAVLNALMSTGLVDRTVVVCTTDHGLAFPGAKGTVTDRGTGVMLIVRGPGGFSGGKVVNSLVSQLDVYPTLCDLAGVATPAFVQGRSLMPLVRGEAERIRDEVFAELTYHVAYDPQRSVRTERHRYIRRYEPGPPVLANVDDGPTKDKLVELGWGEQPVPGEQLYDLVLDPNEMRNLAADPAHAAVRDELRARLERWMLETGDPLLDGPVPAPPGARVNRRTDISPHDHPRTVLAPAGDDARAAARGEGIVGVTRG